MMIHNIIMCLYMSVVRLVMHIHRKNIIGINEFYEKSLSIIQDSVNLKKYQNQE